MISERTLRQWRKTALVEKEGAIHRGDTLSSLTQHQFIETQERILRLTQELMDLHLMKKG